MLGGPLFEPVKTANFKKITDPSEAGAHYSIFVIKNGMAALREIFPNGAADEMNFVLFSTSGVHGSYITIEEIEVWLANPNEDSGNHLTVLIVQPRLVCMRYGTFEVQLGDISYLKKLRESSHKIMAEIGM